MSAVEPEGTASRRSGAGWASWRSTSLRERPRCAGGEECGTFACFPFAAVDASLGAFDTVLMMCGNFGLVRTAAQAVLVLRTLHGMTTPSTRIVLDSVDPHQDDDPAELAYQERNRARGHLPGLVTIRLRYRESATPWFELLNLSPRGLEDLAAEAGWQLAHLVEGEPPEYYAILEKTSDASAKR
jgi:hypothetical protein